MSKNFKYILDFVGNNRQLINSIGQNNKALNDMERNSQKSNSAVNSMFGGLKNIAGAMGVAFGAREIVQFTGHLAKMSGVVEGVEAAFYKIATHSDLQELRTSVKGTVNDLELMKRAVMANNFEIPLEQLGALFEFATKRAQDTGQSVDYLVESIILGIGRKSPLILDNLGISAVKLREKFGGLAAEEKTVGDIAKAVGEIASEAMRQTGEIIDTNAIKIESLAAQWENAKERISKNQGFKEAVSKEIDEVSDNMEVFFSENLTGWQKFLAAVDVTGLGGQIKYLADVSRQATRNNDAIKEFAGTWSTYSERLKPFRFYQKKSDLDEFNEFWNVITNKSAPKPFSIIVDGAQDKVKEYANSIEGLNERLKDYNAELIAISPKDRGALMAKLAQINAIESQIKSIDELKKSQAEAIEQAKYWSSVKPAAVSFMTTTTKNLKVTARSQDEIDKDKTDIEKWTSQLDPMNAMLDANQQKVDDWKNALIEKQRTVQGAFQSGFQNIGQSVVDGLGLAESGFEGFVSGLATTVVNLIAMFLSQALAASIAGNTTAGAATGPLAPAMIPAYVATGIAGVMAAFAAIPKFADGGVVYGPTMGLIGEYPGAASNPEVIAPLSKLQAMLAPAGGSTVILQPGIDFSGDRMRVFLRRVDNKTTKRTGK